MQFSGVRAGVIAGVGVVVMALAGCGASGSSGSSANDRHVDNLSVPAGTSPNDAAVNFGTFYEAADASNCGSNTEIDGYVSNHIWDTYSCRGAMTAREIRQRCVSGNGGADAHRARFRTVPRDPKTVIEGPISWQVGRSCRGHRHHTANGTYQVTLTKTSAGWIVTHFKTLTGPGAGYAR